MKSILKGQLSVVLVLFVSAFAWAHGDAMHVDVAKTVAMEQKPWGIAAQPTAVKRTIDITMDDRMRFTPSAIEVKEGERVRLRIRNVGQIQHELVLGTHDELMAHAQMMKRFPGMEHDEPYMAQVSHRVLAILSGITNIVFTWSIDMWEFSAKRVNYISSIINR